MKKENDVANYDNFLADFNLYLCEWFAERNSANMDYISNGRIFTAKTKEFDIHARLWEHSGGLGLPDNTLIITRALFSKEQLKNFENLLRFFKAYAPLYGFDQIAIEHPPIDPEGDKTEYGFSSPQKLINNRWQLVEFASMKLPEYM